MSMDIDIFDNTLIVIISGELDDHIAKTNRGRLDHLLRRQSIKNVIFDFSELSMMDSAGIGLVIGRYKLIADRGGSAAIVLGNSPAKKTLTMSGLLKLFMSFPDLDSATLKLCGRVYSRI